METGTLFLDKSAFQALSGTDAARLQLHFVHGLTPTLVYEVLADLTKPAVSKAPSDFVRELAAKFGGSGGAVNISYRTLLAGELLGRGEVPMTGQILPQNSSLHEVDGESAAFVGLTGFNDAILRWSRGEFLASDLDLALVWRSETRGFSLVGFHAYIAREGIPLRRPSQDLSDLLRIADDVIGDTARQGSWLSYFLDELGAPPSAVSIAMTRWARDARRELRQFAPFTWHCIRAFVAVSTLWAHKMTKLEPNNYVDVQYLYYLPFCQYFGSEDRLHRALAPLLMRDDQRFLRVDDLRRAARSPRQPSSRTDAG